MTLAPLSKMILLAVALTPFAYFSFQDNLLHFKIRKVSKPEHLLHLIIGILLFLWIRGMFHQTQDWRYLAGLAFAGSVDEFYFHRNLPALEVEAHAKAHWSLFLFLAVFLVLSTTTVRLIFEQIQLVIVGDRK